MSDSLQPTDEPSRLLCAWDSPGNDTETGCYYLLQGIFLTEGSNLHLLCFLHWQAGFFTTSATWEAPGLWWALSQKMNKNESVVSMIVTDSIVNNDKIQTFQAKIWIFRKTLSIRTFCCELSSFLILQDFSEELGGVFDIIYYKYVKIWKMCLNQQASSFLHGQSTMLQNYVWLKVPYKVQDRPMDFNETEYKISLIWFQTSQCN